MAFDRTGAAVMSPVMVRVNTFDKPQSTASDEAAKVRDTGLVWAAASTVMTPEAYSASTELEPAVNLLMAALVTLKPVMLALVDASVVIVELVAPNRVAVRLATKALVRLAEP